MSKQQLRQKMITLRKSFLPPYQIQASRQICEQIKQLPEYHEAGAILAYFAIQNEVSLYPLIEDAWKQGKRVALPSMEEDTIVPRLFTSPAELEIGEFQLLQPNPDCEKVMLETIDIVFVPGVAFDHQHYRLGFGKGHFDRFFANLTTVYKCGVAYQEQIVDTIYPEPHDIPMDAVISSV